MLNQHLAIDLDQIAAFCERHHIRKLSLFGSVLREDFRPDSDIDVLVEFEPGQTPGWNIVLMQDELAALLGREVDFITYGGLKGSFREKVLRTAQVLYERKG
jgi:uncharacterized protein